MRDTLGRPVAEGGVLVTLRPDLPGGVSLGGTETIEPGETKRVEASLAMQLIASGRASRAKVPVVAEEEPTSALGSDAPATPPPVRKRGK